jgi:hypothetical protein
LKDDFLVRRLVVKGDAEALVEVARGLEPLADDLGLNLVLGKILGSGWKVMVVPEPRPRPMVLSFVTGRPCLNSIW